MPHNTHLPPFHLLRLACSPPPRLSPPRWSTPSRSRALASGNPHSSPGSTSGSASNLDAVLSAADLLCLAPPAICSAVCAVRLIVKPSAALATGTGRMLVMQYLLLVGAVAIGALVRRKQWERLCQPSALATGDVDLVGRLDKVEESVRGVVAAVAALSTTVEKLGARFRVLRRTLRDPISDTATLAQKNSKATQILAVQENLLEKEIGSIQKVLYAMQENGQGTGAGKEKFMETEAVIPNVEISADNNAEINSDAPMMQQPYINIVVTTATVELPNNNSVSAPMEESQEEEAKDLWKQNFEPTKESDTIIKRELCHPTQLLPIQPEGTWCNTKGREEEKVPLWKQRCLLRIALKRCCSSQRRKEQRSLPRRKAPTRSNTLHPGV